MDFDEMVRLLSAYYADDGETVERLYGPEARDLVEEMTTLLEEQITAETPFAAMWAEFKQAPAETEAELIGALEVLEEANPTLVERLQAYYASIQFNGDARAAEMAVEMDYGEDDLRGRTDSIAAEPNADNTSMREGNYAEDNERFTGDEVDEENFRYPVRPDYIDESNLYLVGDRDDDQTTSPIMYFDEEGSDNADYSALPESELDDYDEADDEVDDPDQIA